MEFMSLYFRFVAKQLLDEHDDEHDDEHEDARSTPALEPFLYADEKQKHSYTQISAHVIKCLCGLRCSLVLHSFGA